MLSSTLNPGTNLLTLRACSVASYHAISSVCIDYDTVTVCLELFHNITPSASVNNWCGFYYTSCRKLNLSSPLTLGHMFLSNSLWGLLYLTKLQGFLNYLPVIYAWNTYTCQNIPITYTKSGWVLLEHTWASDSWSIWNLFHLIDLLIGSWDIKIPKLITLDYQGRLYFTYILYFLISFLSMSYAIILIPL